MKRRCSATSTAISAASFSVGIGDDWTDLVFWRSKADAEKAMETIAGSSVCRDYFACMAGADAIDAGTDVVHYAALRTYGVADGIAATAMTN